MSRSPRVARWGLGLLLAALATGGVAAAPPAGLLDSVTLVEWRVGRLVGTVEQVCEKIEQYRALGLGGIVAWPRDFPDDTSLRIFAEKVIPEFR